MLHKNRVCARPVYPIILFFTLVLANVSCIKKEGSREDWPQFMGFDRDGTWHLDVKKDTLLPADLE